MPQPTKWKPDFFANAFSNSIASDPTLVASTTGRFLLGFTNMSSTSNDLDGIIDKYSSAGSSNVLQVQGSLNDNDGIDEQQLSLAAFDQGPTVTTWTARTATTGQYDIFARVEFGPVSSSLTGTFMINVGAATGIQERPEALALNNPSLSSASFVVAWIDHNNADRIAFAIRDIAGNVVKAPTALSTSSVVSTTRFDLAELQFQNFVAVYGTSGGDTKFQIVDSVGNLVGGEVDVDGVVGGSSAPSVTMLSDGRFVVVYHGPDGHIDGRIFNNNGTPATAVFDIMGVTITPTDVREPDRPQVSALDDGRFMVVAQRGNFFPIRLMDIFGQVMTADGAKDGNTFQVNDVSTGNQDHPTIATLADGRVVISWQTTEEGHLDVKSTIFDPRESGIALSGTTASDDYVGTSFADTIITGRGDDVAAGGAGDDVIYGGPGGDILSGDAGNDVLHGDGGDDSLIGGAGIDSAVFAGNRSAYTITHLNGPNYRMVGPEGTDIVTNVERFVFDDQTLSTVTQFEAPHFELAAFGAGGSSGGWSSNNTFPRTLADINGDGRADIVGFGSAGVSVSLAIGNGHFGNVSFEGAAFGANAGGWSSQNTYPREMADVNGDDMADIVGFGSAGVSVSLATGNGHFGSASFELAAFSGEAGGWTSQDMYTRHLGDVNGDGMADIVGFGSAGVYVALATGGGHFGSGAFKLSAFGSGAGGWTSDNIFPRELADVNGDGMADIIGFGSPGVYVSLATGGGNFANGFLALSAYGPAAGGWDSQDHLPRYVTDINHDGRADIVGFGNSQVFYSLGQPNGSFSAGTPDLSAFVPNAGGWNSNDLYHRVLGDVDGDGNADILGFGTNGVSVSRAQDVLVL